jgi:hypothetical protein
MHQKYVNLVVALINVKAVIQQVVQYVLTDMVLIIQKKNVFFVALFIIIV